MIYVQWEVTYFPSSSTLVVSLPLCGMLASQASVWICDSPEGPTYVILCAVSGQTIPVVQEDL